MIYLKSILAGLAASALVAFTIGLWVQGLQYRAAMSMMPGDHYRGDIWWHRGPFLCVLLIVFAVGFWWQYRKARTR